MFKNTHSWSILLLTISVIALTPGCSKQARKERYLKKAEQYFATKDYNKAEVEYLNVLRLDRLNRNAIQRLGIIYFEEGSPLRAFSLLLKAKELAPDDLEARLNLGITIMAQGRTNEALSSFDAVLQKSPTNALALRYVQALRARTQ